MEPKFRLGRIGCVEGVQRISEISERDGWFQAGKNSRQYSIPVSHNLSNYCQRYYSCYRNQLTRYVHQQLAKDFSKMNANNKKNNFDNRKLPKVLDLTGSDEEEHEEDDVKVVMVRRSKRAGIELAPIESEGGDDVFLTSPRIKKIKNVIKITPDDVKSGGHKNE